MLKLLLLELLWHICTSLLISIADKDRHHLQFTNEIIKPQKLAQGNRAIRNAHVFESFSAWFQSPFYSIASGLDRVFPSQKWLIVWRERRRKKLNTEDKRITGVSTVVGKRVWTKVWIYRFTLDLITQIGKTVRREGEFGIVAAVHCGWKSSCLGLFAVLRKLGFMFLSYEHSRKEEGMVKEQWNLAWSWQHHG